jgi:hypothetical protein
MVWAEKVGSAFGKNLLLYKTVCRHKNFNAFLLFIEKFLISSQLPINSARLLIYTHLYNFSTHFIISSNHHQTAGTEKNSTYPRPIRKLLTQIMPCDLYSFHVKVKCACISQIEIRDEGGTSNFLISKFRRNI